MLLTQDILNIGKARMGGDNHYSVTHADAVLTAWDDYFAVAVNKGYQQLVLQRQLGKRGVGYVGLHGDTELNSFNSVVEHVV